MKKILGYILTALGAVAALMWAIFATRPIKKQITKDLQAIKNEQAREERIKEATEVTVAMKRRQIVAAFKRGLQ